MKEQLQSMLGEAITTLRERGELLVDKMPAIPLQRTRDATHGEYASPVALSLAKLAGRKPLEIAELIVAALPIAAGVTSVKIAGPGFINFFLDKAVVGSVLKEILALGPEFGNSTVGQQRRVMVEFVSANPTGPLHVGHGRGAAYGAAVANLLAAVGFDVAREYYVNDAGRQMDILALSVWLRYAELGGEAPDFPRKGYQGAYIKDLAADLRISHEDRFLVPLHAISAVLTEAGESDQEDALTAAIEAVKQALGAVDYDIVFHHGRQALVADIRSDLEQFGVTFDQWSSELDLKATDAIERTIERLRNANHLYEQEGATWFRASEFGDEKDRVLIRANGEPTYFTPDLAYHMRKFERGFERLIDVWGADHHGYLPRVRGGLQALGYSAESFDVLFVQFASLYRGAEKVQMSTRSGEFVTLRELREEVGRDAARFFYVMRRCEQHLDFDLELAKSRSHDNPVYYIQYAYARIAGVLRQADERDLGFDPESVEFDTDLLCEAHEQALLKNLAKYPDLVTSAAKQLEPHQVAYYLRDVATDFHTYYNAHVFLVEDAPLRNARLALIAGVAQVIANGLGLLGVSAPTSM